MGIDIRIPIGAMFALLGVILTAYGIFANHAIYEKSLGLNINLWWGLVMLVFGVVMLLLGRRGGSAGHMARDDSEGGAAKNR
jgi:hypothetical protein